MKKNKKILLCILTGMLLMNANPKVCLALTWGGTDTGGSNNASGQENPWNEYTNGNKLYRYRYSSGVYSGFAGTTNLYNMEGESLTPYDPPIVTEEQIAGTWVGVNVTERQWASWNVTNFEAHEIKKVYTCTYSKPEESYACGTITGACGVSSCGSGWYLELFATAFRYGCCKKTQYCSSGPITKTNEPVEKDYNESYTCPPPESGWSLDVNVEELEVSAGDTENYLRQKAYNDAAASARASVKSSMYQVQYIKKNSILENIEPGILTGKAKYDGPIGIGVGGASGTYYQEYEFYPNNVCINVKTAKVEYRQEGCKTSEGEIKIKNETIRDEYSGKDVTYWHYFIPLDTKKNSAFKLNIIPTSEVSSYGVCKSIMEDKGNDPTIYTKYIVPYNAASSNRVYSFDENESHQYNLNILRLAGGCQSSIEIDIPIKQRFYNEQENNTFKGFNFYYRPININDPFPNGIATNSIWYEWSENGRNDPDLTNSYNEVTYIAQDINVSTVRNYTKNNPYTSWDNMKINGASQFIVNEGENGIVKRRNDISFYKLGCGPSNADWSECK